MKLTTNQEDEFTRAHLKRTFEQIEPELVEYMYRGAQVLDVGCGPGAITIGVARAVHPGCVFGVDPIEHHIETAIDLAKKMNVANVDFRVADGYVLPFADETFDLVFSHTVLHYFFDPERALREQMRITKRGGWVVAAGVRDWDIIKRYPACPAWEAVLEARARWSRRTEGNYKKNDDRQFGHSQAGRECPRWFANIGLKDLRVTGKVERVEYSGAEKMEPQEMDLLPWEGTDRFGLYAQYAAEYTEMISAGLIDQDTLQRAMEEAKAWYKDPHAFHLYLTICVAGRV